MKLQKWWEIVSWQMYPESEGKKDVAPSRQKLLNFQIKWSIACKAKLYICGAKQCQLCLAEKQIILQADPTRCWISDLNSRRSAGIKPNSNWAKPLWRSPPFLLLWRRVLTLRNLVVLHLWQHIKLFCSLNRTILFQFVEQYL